MSQAYLASLAGVYPVVEPRGFVAAHPTQHGGAVEFCNKKKNDWIVMSSSECGKKRKHCFLRDAARDVTSPGESGTPVHTTDNYISWVWEHLCSTEQLFLPVKFHKYIVRLTVEHQHFACFGFDR